MEEWKNTLIKLELNIGSDKIERGNKKEYTKMRLETKNFGKYLEFAVDNNINLDLEIYELGYVNTTVRGLERLKERFFRDFDDDGTNCEKLNIYSLKIYKMIVKLIDAHFEPERNRIKETMKEMTPIRSFLLC